MTWEIDGRGEAHAAATARAGQHVDVDARRIRSVHAWQWNLLASGGAHHLRTRCGGVGALAERGLCRIE